MINKVELLLRSQECEIKNSSECRTLKLFDRRPDFPLVQLLQEAALAYPYSKRLQLCHYFRDVPPPKTFIEMSR